MSTEHWDLDQDNTLGGNSPSPNKVSSQKALKEYIDSQSGGGSSTVFVATYGTTTFNEVWTAYDAGKIVFVKDDTTTIPASAFGGILAVLNYFEFNSGLDAHFEFASSILNDGTYYTYTLDQDSTWVVYTEQIPDTSGFANTNLSNLSATGETHFLKNNTTAGSALSLLGSSTTGYGSISIGTESSATNSGIAIGYGESGHSSTTATGVNSIALGVNAKATALCSIQLGSGTNSTANSLYFGSYVNNQIQNYQLLDGTTGLIPDARISTNIARTSQIPSTSGLANTSLSNLSSTGQKVIDGQWVNKHSTLADTVSMGNATSKTYSLTSYLPDATYNYEVMFSGLVITAASSGKFLKMILDSSVVSNVWVCDARTRTSSAMEATGSCIIPISKNSQQIVMKSEASSNSSGTMSLVALAYRRIGTNT